MIHVDVKKLGNIADGGGWRFVGRQQGAWNRQATPGNPRNTYGNELMKHALVHTVIDDHSRVAYDEVHDDETALTATGVLARAVGWFAARAITVEHVLSDNGSPYVSTLWAQVCHQLGLVHKRPRPRRPQTNGKIERFHRTMADGWAYARCYTSEQQRRALAGWIHLYNHHRPHPACNNRPPITRFSTPSKPVQAVTGLDEAGVRVLPPTARRGGLLGEERLPAHAPRLILAHPCLSLRQIADTNEPLAQGVQLLGRGKLRAGRRRPRDLPEGVEGARCTRVCGQTFLRAFSNPLPPSVTTSSGGAILSMRAAHAREFSLRAT